MNRQHSNLPRSLTLLVMLVHVTAVRVLADNATRPTEHIVFGPNDTQRCLKCHGMANFAFRDSAAANVNNYTVNADTFKFSVHGKQDCQQCHADIKEYPHRFEKSRTEVSCGTDCHATDSTGKAYTHQVPFSEFTHSVHRKGLTGENQDSPTCTTCHGEGNPHGIAKAKKAMTVHERMNLCVGCHDDAVVAVRNKINPEAVSSYRRSFHYKATIFGQTNTAVCQDCHTVHHILPKDSVASSISTGNIAQTCGQQLCHPGARMNFAMSGANHLGLRIEREPLLWWLERFFVVLTVGTMAMLVVGIILDVQRKFGWVIVFGRLRVLCGNSWNGVRENVVHVARLGKRILID